MRWRAILGVAVGLLLPLPFLLFQVGLSPWFRSHPTALASRGRKVPVLALDKRRELLTFIRSCQSTKDCEPPLACLGFYPSSEKLCLDSDCMTDLQCKQDFVCRTREVPDDDARVRQCVRVGTRQEGQPCFVSANVPDEACARGLYCENGRCGRPCEREVPATCPSGTVCREGLDATVCRPFCRGGDCPQGQECVDAGSDTASCMPVVGDDCQRTPCPPGQRCSVSTSPGATQWTATLQCLTPCDVQHACPEGAVCLSGYCRRTCDQRLPGACGPLRHCALWPDERLATCEPLADSLPR